LIEDLIRNTRLRGHAAAADAMALDAQVYELRRQALALRRRYWREMATAARLSGHPWPEAEERGVEP
jgi:hypothetical protein